MKIYYLLHKNNDIKGIYSDKFLLLVKLKELYDNEYISNIQILELLMNSNLVLETYEYNKNINGFLTEFGLCFDKDISEEKKIIIDNIYKKDLLVKQKNIINKNKLTINRDEHFKLFDKKTRTSFVKSQIIDDKEIEELRLKEKELLKKIKEEENKIKEERKLLEITHNNTVTKLDEIGFIKYKKNLEDKKISDEKRQFEAAKLAYIKIKSDMEKDLPNIENQKQYIKKNAKDFYKKFIIFDELNNENKINSEDVYTYFLEKYQIIKLKEYIKDKKMYYEYKEAIKDKEISIKDIKKEFRQRYEMFDAMYLEKCLKPNYILNDELKKEYENFIIVLKEYAVQSRHNMFQPHNIEYIKEGLRPKLELDRNIINETEDVKNSQDINDLKKDIENSEEDSKNIQEHQENEPNVKPLRTLYNSDKELIQQANRDNYSKLFDSLEV